MGIAQFKLSVHLLYFSIPVGVNAPWKEMRRKVKYPFFQLMDVQVKNDV